MSIYINHSGFYSSELVVQIPSTHIEHWTISMVLKISFECLRSRFIPALHWLWRKWQTTIWEMKAHTYTLILHPFKWPPKREMSILLFFGEFSLCANGKCHSGSRKLIPQWFTVKRWHWRFHSNPKNEQKAMAFEDVFV